MNHLGRLIAAPPVNLVQFGDVSTARPLPLRLSISDAQLRHAEEAPISVVVLCQHRAGAPLMPGVGPLGKFGAVR